MNIKETERRCKQCKKILISNKRGQPKKYCNLECKRAWEKENRVLHIDKEINCSYCGKVFGVPQNSGRKYCSRDCYIRDRYWRKEDLKKITDDLMEGKQIKKIPIWIKEQMQNEI